MSPALHEPSEAVPVDRATARRAAVAGAVGSLVEWYDFGLYGVASALYIRPLFFGEHDPFVGYLLAFATFAVGFAARPLGGIVLGNLGDRYGRKPVLLFTVVLMGASTTLIGLLPTSQSVGALAALLLVILRVLQGFGAGAEIAGAFVYVTESAPQGRRAVLSSYSSAATAAGLFLATGVYAVSSALLSPAQMLSYGWRIPFLLSAVVVVVAIAVRSRLEDSPEFARIERAARRGRGSKDRIPILTMLRESRRSTLAGLLAPTAISVPGYIISVYSLSYVSTQGMSATVVLVGTLSLAGVSAVTCVLFGRLADRVGSRRVFIGGAIWFMLFAFPFFLMLRSGEPAWIVLALVLGYAIGWGACAGAQGQFLSSLFPTRHRYSGVALTREINASFLGGPTPFVAVALAGVLGGEPWLVAALMIIASAVTIVGVLLGSGQEDSSGARSDARPEDVAPYTGLAAGQDMPR